MAKAELKLTSLGFWRGYSSANRAGVYSELVAVAPIFYAMMNERLVNTKDIINAYICYFVSMLSSSHEFKNKSFIVYLYNNSIQRTKYIGKARIISKNKFMV